MTEMTPELHHELVQNLLAHFRHQDPEADLVETHISSVILAGDTAYKIKKPHDFGFLDFSTLEKRKFFCEEEIRLNRRLAPSLYIDVQPVTGVVKAPVPGGEGAPVEYMVRMRRFAQQDQLDRLLEQHEIPLALMDEIAERMAAFHAQADKAGDDDEFGTPEAVRFPVQQNFDQLYELVEDESLVERLKTLERWSQEQFQRLEKRLQARRQAGFIRECHGDMHLGNIALVDDEIVIFDGIEFNQQFRWIDVMSELAFLLMDLTERELPRHANRLLNRYLEITGDYAGLQLLQFYKVYRALVRAKVNGFRLADPHLPAEEREQVLDALQAYVALAERFTHMGPAYMGITVGVAGSGKSTAAQWLVDTYGAIRVRSDAERQRLFAERDETGKQGLNQGIYTAEATTATYERLAELAGQIIQSGYGVIIDATCLKQHQRRLLRSVADTLDVAFIILKMNCPVEVLEQRIRARQAEGRDISEADLDVLHMQLEGAEPLTVSEEDKAIDAGCADETTSDRLLAGFAQAVELAMKSE